MLRRCSRAHFCHATGNGSGNGNGHTNGNGTNGNGTSAFHPLGHHHHHGHNHTHQHQHNGQPDSSRSSRPKAQSSSAPAAAAAAKAPAGHHQHPATTAAEGSNGNGNGMSGTNNGMSGTNNNTSGTNDAGRDEGRSSSDLEGPTQAQVLQRHQLQQEQQAAEEDTAGGQLQQQQVVSQDGTPAAQLQALLANLHGMCGASPLMQAYGAAAAAQQMLASALQHLPNGATATAGPDVQQHAGSQLLAALQQQLAQGGTNMGQMQQQAHPHPPGSQGFAPWHADGTQAPAAAFNTAAGLHALSQQGGATPADAAASAQLAAAAAGLMGLGGGGSWGAGTAASASMSACVAGVNLPLTQQFQRRPLDAASVAAAAANAAVSAGVYPGMINSSGAAAIAAAAAAQQQLQQTGFGVNAAQHGAFGSMSAAVTAAAALGGFGEVSGLELLSRAAQSAGALVAGEGCVGTPAGGPAAGAGCRQVRASRSSDHSAPRARKPTQTL